MCSSFTHRCAISDLVHRDIDPGPDRLVFDSPARATNSYATGPADQPPARLLGREARLNNARVTVDLARDNIRSVVKVAYATHRGIPSVPENRASPPDRGLPDERVSMLSRQEFAETSRYPLR